MIAAIFAAAWAITAGAFVIVRAGYHDALDALHRSESDRNDLAADHADLLRALKAHGFEVEEISLTDLAEAATPADIRWQA